MSTSNKLATAALTGLLSFAVMGAGVAHAADVEKTATAEKAIEKHSCKGKNSCKGQGAGGKNECKGKGACATDVSKDTKEMKDMKKAQ